MWEQARRMRAFRHSQGYARGAGMFALCLALMSLTACWPAQPQSSATPSVCDPATQWRAPADNVALDDLALVAQGEGWAVGALTPQQGDPAGVPTGVMYQLTQGQWRRMPQTYPGAELSTISMDGPDDGWAASTSAVTGTGDRALVVHYTGGQWKQVDIPALDKVLKGPPQLLGGSIGAISVRMFGQNAGWMFAWTNIPRDLSNPASRMQVVILRYQHGVWTPVPAPNVTITTDLFALSAVSGDEAWAVGTDYGDMGALTTIFAHYANGGWSIWPQTFSGVTEQLAMTSPSEGWAFRDGADGNPAPLRYTSASWAPLATPADWTSKRIILLPYAFPMGSGVTWFAATTRDRRTLLAEYANGQWRRVAWPYGDIVPLRIIPGSSGELWGLGNIVHMEGCGSAHITAIQQGVFLHYQQGNWGKDVLP